MNDLNDLNHQSPLGPPSRFFQCGIQFRSHTQIEDVLNLHFTFHLSRISRPIDHLFHVALLESAAGIVPAHLIFIGFSRHFTIVDAQYFLDDIERFLRLLAEK